MFRWDYCICSKKHAAVGTADVRTLHVFYAKNSRTFQGFSWTFFDNYLKPSEMFVLNDTGLALWYPDNYIPKCMQKPPVQKKREFENTCKPDMCCALVAQHTWVRATRESTGKYEKHRLSHISFKSTEDIQLSILEINVKACKLFS